MAPIGRPPGSATKKRVQRTPAPYKPEIRVRAHHIYRFSGGLAKPITIARQLADEGYGDVDPAAITRWAKAESWDEKAVALPSLEAMSFSEDLRQAVRMRVPDDLARVEQASHGLADLASQLAQHISKQMPSIEIKTVGELDVATRCMAELMKIHLATGKAVGDLRLLRAASNFGGGEIIPPTKADQQPAPPPVDLNAALSNFQ